MNFYPHHIGDYLTATAHLSWAEDCAYRRLLDLYYSREAALPADLAAASRLARAVSKDERKAVESVLREFFTLTDAGWSHGRCEEEIAKAKVASERSKANGMKGGRPAKQKPTSNPEETQQVISGLSVGTQMEPDPKAPITNPITNPKHTPKPPSGVELRFERFWDAYPSKVGKDAAIKAFEKRKPDDALTDAMIAAIAVQRASPKWTKDGGEYIPNPATWLNQGRWLDEVPTADSKAGIFAGCI